MFKNSIDVIKVDSLFSKFSFELSFDSTKNVSILIAPNGFGKTTLFHFLNFLLHPSYESYMSILGIPFKRIACIMKDGSEYGVALGKCNKEDTSAEVQKILTPQNGHLFYWYKETNKDVHKWCLDKILKDNLSLYKRSLKSSDDKQTTDNDTKYILDCLFTSLRSKLCNYSVKFLPADRLFVSEERKNSIYSDLNLNNMNETISQKIQLAKNEYAKKYIKTINKYVDSLALTNHDKENSDNRYGVDEKEIVRIKECLAENWKIYSKKVQIYTEHDLLSEYYEEKPNGNLFAGDDYDHTNKILIIVNELLLQLIEAMKPIDELFSKLELFLKIINERLNATDKKIDLVQGKLVVLPSAAYEKKPVSIHGLFPTNDEMPLTILSSGEKNDLYLFYELIFSTDKVGLVLIDEPEISWHIEWQMSFIDLLKEICEMNHFQAIVATHSPSIINGHIDLIAERVNKHYV